MPPKVKAPTKEKPKVLSGHCGIGNCEGTRNRSLTGKPFPACRDWKRCACKCHKKVTDIYEMAGVEREEPEENPEYVEAAMAERTLFRPPSVNASRPLAAPFNDGATRGPQEGQGAPAAPAPAPTAPAFLPTPTGRRARGQLEYDVLRVCIEFANDVYDWPGCYPKLVAERIGRITQDEPPSTGAIQAVWQRWLDMGFATMEKKPVRFEGFTSNDTDQSARLETMKLAAKRERLRTKGELKRGSIRPRGR